MMPTSLEYDAFVYEIEKSLMAYGFGAKGAKKLARFVLGDFLLENCIRFGASNYDWHKDAARIIVDEWCRD